MSGPPPIPTTHLEIRHRKMLPQTRPRPIRKGEQMPIPIDLFRLGRYPILAVSVLQPSTWSEDFRVLTPKHGGAVHGFYRDRNQRALGDRQAVDHLTIFCADGFRKWDDIIFDGLWNNAGYVINEEEGWVERYQWGRTTRVISTRGGWTRRTSWTTASR